MPLKDLEARKKWGHQYYLRNKDRWKEREKEQTKNLTSEEKEERRKKRRKWSNKSYYKHRIKIQKKRKEKYVEVYLNSAYHLTVEDYYGKLKEQGGVCAICGGNAKGRPVQNLPLVVDHNHKTNQNRGLLCYACNFLIGHAKENTEILKKAIKYLELWEQKKD